MALSHSELDKNPRDFSPCNPNPYLYHDNYLLEGLTTANFDGNQLSPLSIGFSPLHPGYENACTQHLFGPPRHFTGASPYPGVDQAVSGRIGVTAGTFIPRSSQAASCCFRYGSSFADCPCHTNTLPGPLFKTDSTRPTWDAYQTISFRFQILFTPCHGFFSAFLRSTRTLSDLSNIQGWELMPPIFGRRIQDALLRTLPCPSSFPLRVYHPLWSHVPVDFESR